MGKVKEAYAEIEALGERLAEISVDLCETLPLGDALIGLGHDDVRKSIRADLDRAMDRLRYDILPHEHDKKDVDLINKG